jgi:nicotinamide-nucleotide amidase
MQRRNKRIGFVNKNVLHKSENSRDLEETNMQEAVLNRAAQQLVESLRVLSRKAVLAESCTCGRAVAALGTIAGVSQYLCGAWVVYRPSAKSEWLGLELPWLEQVSTESLACSQALALAALQRTSEAHLSLAITGDLSPDTPAEKSGRVFLAAAFRADLDSLPQIVQSETMVLESQPRSARQIEAATRLLELGVLALGTPPRRP